MSILIKISIFIVFFSFIPYGAGLLFCKESRQENVLQIYLNGIFLLLAIFQIMALAGIYISASLTVLAGIWGGIGILLALYGYILKTKMIVSPFGILKDITIWGWLAIIVIIIQATISFAGMHLDQDDAFYVATAVTSVETNTLMEIDPYMGFPYELLPARYVLSPFPIFLATISKICGMHPTIIAHTIFPVIFLLISYMVYALVAKEFFDDKSKQQIFLLVIAVVQMFSFFSVYTAGTFLILRLWQGKAFLANIVLPFILFQFYHLIKTENEEIWIRLLITMFVASLVSSMGILLGPLSLGILSLGYAALKKRMDTIIRALLCCSPNIILGIIYLMIR